MWKVSGARRARQQLYREDNDSRTNWVLLGSITAGTEPGGEECKWGAGFVFQFSRDSTAHGFVATGDFNPSADLQSATAPDKKYGHVAENRLRWDRLDPVGRNRLRRLVSPFLPFFFSTGSGLNPIASASSGSSPRFSPKIVRSDGDG